MSNQVFISYSRKDTRFVRYLQTKFEKEEFSFWIDKDRLEGGVDWRQEIDKAIRTSFALIVVLSPESAASKYVTYEW
ncbi:MAG: toll/interleukin-1 receptor domain-containing protein, partial [Anaerolineae bacterium]